ncbi:MAG: hypothetical protein HY906_07755 [Deltaproteobacteria bacterium]|nr:hypothetical protein [Deltaproteobacteria bacterium]
MRRFAQLVAAWRARRTGTALAAVLALCALVGGAGCGPGGPTVRPEAQGLRIVCTVDDAVVLIDERPVGTAALVRERDLPILPGHHRVEVRAERFFTRYADVEIAPGARVKLEVTLRPKLEVP